MRGQCSFRLCAVDLLTVEIAWDALATLSAPLILGVIQLHPLAGVLRPGPIHAPKSGAAIHVCGLAALFRPLVPHRFIAWTGTKWRLLARHHAIRT